MFGIFSIKNGYHCQNVVLYFQIATLAPPAPSGRVTIEASLINGIRHVTRDTTTSKYHCLWGSTRRFLCPHIHYRFRSGMKALPMRPSEQLQCLKLLQIVQRMLDLYILCWISTYYVEKFFASTKT